MAAGFCWHSEPMIIVVFLEACKDNFEWSHLKRNEATPGCSLAVGCVVVVGRLRGIANDQKPKDSSLRVCPRRFLSSAGSGVMLYGNDNKRLKDIEFWNCQVWSQWKWMEIIEGTYEAIFGFPKVEGIYMQAKFFLRRGCYPFGVLKRMNCGSSEKEKCPALLKKNEVFQRSLSTLHTPILENTSDSA